MNRQRDVSRVVHGVAVAFWFSCILGVFFAFICYLLLWVGGGIHGANAFDVLDFMSVSRWPILIRVAFVIGSAGAIADVVMRVRNRKEP